MPTELGKLLTQFKAGAISRRAFLHTATALGVTAAGANWLASGGNPAAA